MRSSINFLWLLLVRAYQDLVVPLDYKHLTFKFRSMKRVMVSGAINTEMEFILNGHDILSLCGDWLNGGRVEGAWLSGLKLANAINI